MTWALSPLARPHSSPIFSATAVFLLWAAGPLCWFSFTNTHIVGSWRELCLTEEDLGLLMSSVGQSNTVLAGRREMEEGAWGGGGSGMGQFKMHKKPVRKGIRSYVWRATISSKGFFLIWFIHVHLNILMYMYVHVWYKINGNHGRKQEYSGLLCIIICSCDVMQLIAGHNN